MFTKFLGDYEFIWGPVKKGVCESSYYHFLTSSEELHELDITLGYKTRNAMNAAREKNNLYEQLLIMERIAGTHAFAASLSYCLAAEDYFGLTGKLPDCVKLIRMFFAELERLRNHIENLAEISGSTYLEVPSSLYAYYAEKIKQISSETVFSRYLMGINTVGGTRLHNLLGHTFINNNNDSNSRNNSNKNNDISSAHPADYKCLEYIVKEIGSYMTDIEKIIKQNSETKSHIDRLKTTGKINPKIAEKLHAGGIVAKSAGINGDLRLKYPYLLYKDINMKPVLYNDGDALSRYLVRIGEIRQSFDIMKICFEKLTKNMSEPDIYNVHKQNHEHDHENYKNIADIVKLQHDDMRSKYNYSNSGGVNNSRSDNFSGMNNYGNGDGYGDIEQNLFLSGLPHGKYGFGSVESSEGSIFCITGSFDGKIFKKINIKYPFENNFKVFKHFTKNTMMMDFNINETSYNFSVAACDK